MASRRLRLLNLTLSLLGFGQKYHKETFVHLNNVNGLD
jgi:Holliday junction resolvasome RuvABC DNA-binding subunit